MSNTAENIYVLNEIRKPITGIHQKHLESFIIYLRSYHEDTGEMPSAADYLDMVRNAVENTVAVCPQCHGDKFICNGEGTPVKGCPVCGGHSRVLAEPRKEVAHGESR